MPIVAMIMGDLDAVLSGVVLKSTLGIDGFGRVKISGHQIQARKMVHADGGIFVVGPGESPFHLAKETRFS